MRVFFFEIHPDDDINDSSNDDGDDSNTLLASRFLTFLFVQKSLCVFSLKKPAAKWGYMSVCMSVKSDKQFVVRFDAVLVLLL